MTRELQTVAQFASRTSFTEPQLRWWIKHAQKNGLTSHGAVVRVGGRRVYIDPAAFERWIESQNSARGAA